MDWSTGRFITEWSGALGLAVTLGYLYGMGGVLYGLIIGIPIMSTLGLLIHRRLKSVGWTQSWAYVLVGMLGGLMTGVAALSVFVLPSVISGSQPMNRWNFIFVLTLFPTFALSGACAARFAWLIRRPDDD
jgi:hypothetical protein